MSATIDLSRWGLAAALSMAALAIVQPAAAGDLDSPAAPTNAASAMWTIADLYAVMDTRTTNVQLRADAFAEPEAGPTNGTMHTLNDLMVLATNRAPVARTGQTPTLPFTAETGADGDLQVGVAWPTPRFSIVGADGTPETNQIRDNLTGLIWARNASTACDLAVARTNWTTAIQACNDLTYGGASDWRMPNVRELYSLLTLQYANPPLCNTEGTAKWTQGNPFHNVQQSYYWTSTTHASDKTAWTLYMAAGNISTGDKTNAVNWVWPVRGGY